MRHDEIDLYTDFQRQGDLWDNHKMSRLIESILIRFPLPAFYFDASDDGRWLIVDGLQRLSTIKKFVIDEKLRLRGLEFLPELHGKTFKELSRTYQRRIEECPITIYMIKAGTPADVKYSIFHRINTGGITLNTQEIRNALAKPKDRLFLKELANNELFQKLLGNLSRRLKDQELILRFWAFYKFDYLDKYNKKDYKSFLDNAMLEIANSDLNYKKTIKETFNIALGRCYKLLGESAFERNPHIIGSHRFKNATLFEVLMVCMARISEEKYIILYKNKKSFRYEMDLLLKENTKFITSITSSTQKVIHVENRYKIMMQIIDKESSYV